MVSMGLLLTLIVCLFLCACGENSGKNLSIPKDLKSVAEKTAEELVKTHESPKVSSIDGEWLVIGVHYSGYEAPDSFYSHYYDTLRAEVKSKKGILSEDKYSEYERVLLCLHAIGMDTTQVEGYDLRPYLDDYEKIAGMGASVASFALIASNVLGYPLENEEAYIQVILEEAWSPSIMGEAGLSDYVAMAVEALSFYRGREDVDSFIEDSLTFFSETQNEDGSMINCEATAECIICLVQLGIDPLTDERFIKNGKNLGDGLLTFYLGDGTFFHDADNPNGSEIPTEKALLGLDTLLLSQKGEKLYQ